MELDWFYDRLNPNKDRIVLVIMNVDAYSNDLNFVLGEAFPKRGIGAVYLARIKEEFYGLTSNNKHIKGKSFCDRCRAKIPNFKE